MIRLPSSSHECDGDGDRRHEHGQKERDDGRLAHVELPQRRLVDEIRRGGRGLSGAAGGHHEDQVEHLEGEHQPDEEGRRDDLLDGCRNGRRDHF